MAHKKALSSTKNGRDSQAKRRGVKVYAGTSVIAGNIIVRQKGNKIFPGVGVMQGKDFTLQAVTDGVVRFYEKGRTRFDGRESVRSTYVTVDSNEVIATHFHKITMTLTRVIVCILVENNYRGNTSMLKFLFRTSWHHISRMPYASIGGCICFFSPSSDLFDRCVYALISLTRKRRR
jgi:large subunit ribosomal protein L27